VSLFMWKTHDTDDLVRYASLALSSTAPNNQIAAIVGIEFGCEERVGGARLCEGDFGKTLVDHLSGT